MYLMFSTLNNLSCGRKIDFELLESGLISLHRLLESNSCFFKISVDIVPPWHYVNTHLNVTEEQSAKTADLKKKVYSAIRYDHMFD